MQESKKDIGRIMRIARRLNKFSQRKLSGQIGVSQGTMSKFENNSLTPDIQQWFHFCELTGIDSGASYYSGFVYISSSKGAERLLKNSSVFGFGEKVEMVKCLDILPLIVFIQETTLEKEFHEYLKAKGIDPDIFYVPALSMPVDLFIEVKNFLTKTVGWEGVLPSVASKLAPNLLRILPYMSKDISSYENEIKNFLTSFIGSSLSWDLLLKPSTDDYTLTIQNPIEENQSEVYSQLLDYKTLIIKQLCKDAFDLDVRIEANKDTDNTELGYAT